MSRTIDDLFDGYESGRLTRRQMVQALMLLAASPAAAQTRTALHATHIDHVSILVGDMARSRAFYEGMFGAKMLSQRGNIMQLGLDGASHLTLTLDAERKGTLDHVAVAVDGSSLADALAAARRISPDSKFEVDADGVTYFRDPDGTRLQIVAK